MAPRTNRIIGIIPARGGSKGIPGKNIRKIAGKPLIGWTIDAALDSRSLDRVLVSTDDPEIARVAEDCGADVPFIRPARFATDTATSFAVVSHAMGWLEKEDGQSFSRVMLLQPTSPLRTAADICEAIRLQEMLGAPAVVSVCASSGHPYYLKKIDGNGLLENFLDPCPDAVRRQDLPPVYRVNGALYLNSWDVLNTMKNFIPPGTGAYVMPEERSVDIDTPWDFFIAEQLLKVAGKKK